MKMKYVAFFLALLFACSPKMIVNNHNPSGTTYPKTQVYESFALIEDSEIIDSAHYEIIADLEIKDKGLTVNCDYETIKGIAEKKAREMGGNCLLITEHRKPDIKSTCHRIKAQVLNVKNVEKYENYILWHPKRPLKPSYFRGPIEKRPFQASTYSMIQYLATSSAKRGLVKIVVKSLFDCNLSYFKPSKRDSFVLAHEQLHFDITEIYARKFRKVILEEMSTYKNFLIGHETAFSGILEELALKQDEYDSEVYSDEELQKKWNEWVASEMSRLEKYSQIEIELPKR
jgi:hypothetical protein